MPGLKVANLYDHVNAAFVKYVVDGADSLLGVAAKLRNAAGTIVNPATQETAAAIQSAIEAIRDTAGIKKITDALPTGANTIGKILIQDGLGLGYLASVDSLNRLLVSANVIVPPASVAVSEFHSGSVSGTDTQYYTIPNTKKLTIGSWAGGAEANSGHVTRIALFLDASGTGSPLTKIDEAFLGPGDRNEQRDLNYEITGDATNRIALQRERLDGGSDLVSIRFDGFRDA